MKEKMNQIIEKVGLSKIFFIIVVVIYIGIFVSNNLLFFNSLEQLWKIVINIYWVIILVFVVTFVINLFLNEKKIVTYVGKESGWKGWVIASMAGLISHGPIYLWFPLLSDLKEKGMRDELIATFLYNRAIKIPLLPLMIFYFGFVFTIVLTIYMIIFSIINGMIVGRLIK
jgi:uncharacterized membrane protein YraQ (UPF0718 family)